MQVIIGIDDTDNLETRGTGFQARSLGFSLMEKGLFRLQSITRHQLLVDRRIPYTSHNSSASLTGEATGSLTEIIQHCREFLLKVSAFDADSGLCVAQADKIGNVVVDFGNRAKREILKMEEAVRIASENEIYLEGLLNTKVGLIGSLAACGLRSAGDDGRLLWTRNLRETTGILRAGDFMEITGVEKAVDMEGNEISADARINIGEWCRPVMRGGKITLFTEKTKSTSYEYQSASKEFIKSISE